jgi:hypothetical protein
MVMLSNALLCWRGGAQRDRRAVHPNANQCWRGLGQRHRLMPDALEGPGVLAWLGAAYHVRASIRMSGYAR